ncbi:MAG: aquaporin family protein [Coriobacteriales bacterium]|nr:aquaporin family protein [Coriobacteriales bacterium]
MERLREFVGEAIGTFLLLFLGIGVTTATVLFGASTGVFQIALAWGLLIALCIYASRHLSNAHFNPAVTVAMVVAGRMPARKLWVYILGQLVGATAGAALVWLLFGPSIEAAVAAHGGWGVQGGMEMVFIGTWPNSADAVVSMPLAFLCEAVGTFFLVILIFSLTEDANLGRPDSNTAPLFIGLVVFIVMLVIAPLSNAGINPARDLGPRIIGALVGWGEFAFSWEIIAVYVVAPLLAGVAAALVLLFVIQPLTKSKPAVTGVEKLPASETEKD